MRAEQQRALLSAAERYAALLEEIVTNGATMVKPGQAAELARLRNTIVTCSPPAPPLPGVADRNGNVR